MKMKKALALLLAAILLVACSVMGTLAYLTSTTEVAQNTFTVGDVKIYLDEKDIDNSNQGTALEFNDETYNRDQQNAYKLIPGRVLDKDPTVWVKTDSEDSYIRMLVTVSDIQALKDAFGEGYVVNGVFLLQNLVDWNSSDWHYVSCVEGTKTVGEGDEAEKVTYAVYEFRYNGVYSVNDNAADNKIGATGAVYEALPALFTKITVPGTIDNNQLAMLNGVSIDVIAHAIQAEGFEDADTAWAAFDGQNG